MMKKKGVALLMILSIAAFALITGGCKKSDTTDTTLTAVDESVEEQNIQENSKEGEIVNIDQVGTVSDSSEQDENRENDSTEESGKAEGGNQLEVGVPEGQEAVTDPEVTVIEEDGNLEFVLSESLMFDGE